MRRIFTIAVICLWVAGLGGMVVAAEQDGTLYGRIVDVGDGKPIANAAIIVTSVYGTSTATSDENGEYRISFLKPGSYDVRVEASGFSTIVQEAVKLSLGGRSELNLALTAGKVETVTITGESPLIDHSSSTTGANITEELVESIPIGRQFTNMFFLAPGVTTSLSGNNNSTGAANPSVSGGSGLENNFTVDGINITDSGFGGIGAYSRIFGSRGTAVNVDFIKEVQVKTGGFEPEYGQSTGGVVQAITKSGGNSLSSDVFYYFTGADFEGNRRTTATPNGDFNIHQDGIESSDFGLTIGGRIVRDRLFWFAAYNRVETDTEVFGAATDPDAFFFDEENPVTRSFQADNYAGKLTWQVNPNHRIEFSAFGDPSEDSFSANRSAALFVQANNTIAWSSLEFGGDNLVLRYNGVVTPNFLVEANVAQATNEFTESFPDVNNQTATRDRRVSPNEFLGGIGFYENTENENNQISLKLTNFVGNHEIRYGLQYEDVTYDATRLRTGDTWTIAQPGPDGLPGTSDDPPQFGRQSTSGPSVQILCAPSLAGGPNATIDPTCADPAILRITRGELQNPTVSTTTTYWAPFIQDSWQATPYFVFKFGLRYESQEVSGGGSLGSSFTWDGAWAPRLGFTWDTTKNGKSKLYGSAGRFYSKIPQDLAVRALSAEEGFTRADYYWTDPVADTNGDGVINQVDGVNAALLNPVPDLAGGSSHYIITGGSPTVVDPDAGNSYADEFVLGYEYEIMPNLAIGGRFIYRELGEILEDVAQNYASEVASGVTTFGTYFITNPGPDTPSFHGPFTTDLGSGCDFLNFPGFITYDAGDFDGSGTVDGDDICRPASTANDFPDAERKYFAFELTLDKRLSDNWQLLASYRLARSSGNYEGFFRSDNGQTDPNITSLFDFPDEPLWLFTYSNGVLPTDRTHTLRLNGSYRFNFGSTLGLSWTVQTGAPLNIYDAHPAYDNSGELLVEPRGNSGRTPTSMMLDLHFDYPLRVAKTEFKFFVDMFNVFDQSATSAYDYNRESSVGVPNPDFQYAVNTLPPRTARLGVKFSF